MKFAKIFILPAVFIGIAAQPAGAAPEGQSASFQMAQATPLYTTQSTTQASTVTPTAAPAPTGTAVTGSDQMSQDLQDFVKYQQEQDRLRMTVLGGEEEEEVKKKYQYKGHNPDDPFDGVPMPPRLFNNIPRGRP
jgi:hypothetical protein